MKRYIAVFFVAVAASCFIGFGQQRATSKSTKAPLAKPGIVSGRVFIITDSGDLKPARLANVYLLWMQRTKWNDLTEQERAEGGASRVWAKLNLEAAEKRAELAHQRLEASKTPNTREDAVSKAAECIEDLQTYLSAIGSMNKWWDDPSNRNKILFTNTDEEGGFKIEAQPGFYTLVAYGKAGLYNAFWSLDDALIVDSGKELTAKLAKARASVYLLSARLLLRSPTYERKR